MDIEKELLFAKLALFKMIAQFMYETKDNDGDECFWNYSESAGEAAFSVLGFPDDIIKKSDFYRRYDELEENLAKINGITKSFSYAEWYQKDFEKRKRNNETAIQKEEI